MSYNELLSGLNFKEMYYRANRYAFRADVSIASLQSKCDSSRRKEKEKEKKENKEFLSRYQ